MYMLFFHRKQTVKQIEDKDKAIAKVKEEIHTNSDEYIKKINRVNKVLSNGIQLEVFHAVGGKHG